MTLYNVTSTVLDYNVLGNTFETALNNSNVNNQRTAFGELLTAQPNVRVQGSFLYGIDPRIHTTTTSGTASIQQNNAMIECTSSSSSSSATFQTNQIIKYRNGQGCLLRYTTIFDTPQNGSTQHIGWFDDDNGFFIGYNTNSEFGFFVRRDGVDTFYEQSTWSENTYSTLDPQKGNVIQIKFQYLGFGMIFFYIEDKDTGQFTLCHKIKYANTNIQTSLLNPTFPYRIQVINTTNSSALTAKSASYAGFIEGKVTILGEIACAYNTKNISTTLTNILTIRNPTTYFSKPNKSYLQLMALTASTEGNKTCTVIINKNATLTSASFSSVTGMMLEEDTSGTYTTSTGFVIASLQLAKASDKYLDLTSLDSFLAPGETLTVLGQFNSTGSGDVSISLIMKEDN